MQEKLVKSQQVISANSEMLIQQKLFLGNLEKNCKQEGEKAVTIQQERNKLLFELNEFKLAHDIQVENMQVQVKVFKPPLSLNTLNKRLNRLKIKKLESNLSKEIEENQLLASKYEELNEQLYYTQLNLNDANETLKQQRDKQFYDNFTQTVLHTVENQSNKFVQTELARIAQHRQMFTQTTSAHLTRNQVTQTTSSKSVTRDSSMQTMPEDCEDHYLAPKPKNVNTFKNKNLLYNSNNVNSVFNTNLNSYLHDVFDEKRSAQKGKKKNQIFFIF